MSELENAVQAEETTDDWLMGCTLCDEGLCRKIDELIEQKKLKQAAAIRVVTNLANEKVGAEIFNSSTIKRKYYVAKGLHEEKPKKKTVRNLTKTQENTEPETNTAQGSASSAQETPQDNQETILETQSNTSVDDSDQLAEALTGSIKAVIAGLKAFNEAEAITQNETLRASLADVLVDVIPDVKMALSRINRNE